MNRSASPVSISGISNSSQDTHRKRSPEPSSFEPSQANKRPHLSGPQRPGPSLSNLPTELMVQIFSYLHLRHVAPVRLVCRSVNKDALVAFDHRKTACMEFIEGLAFSGGKPARFIPDVFGNKHSCLMLADDILHRPGFRKKLDSALERLRTSQFPGTLQLARVLRHARYSPKLVAELQGCMAAKTLMEGHTTVLGDLYGYLRLSKDWLEFFSNNFPMLCDAFRLKKALMALARSERWDELEMCAVFFEGKPQLFRDLGVDISYSSYDDLMHEGHLLSGVGKMLYAQGKKAMARRFLNLALAKGSRSGVYGLLGQISEGQNKREEAVFYYMTALRAGAWDRNGDMQASLLRLSPGVSFQDDSAYFDIVKKLAEQGHAHAQSTLGVLYGCGEGVSQDSAQSAHWWRKAAEQGNAEAQFFLGIFYEKAPGVAQNFRQAEHWYRQAADQGFAGAQWGLGNLYYAGEGVRQDFAQAAHWFRQAADRGYARAQYNLGNLYYAGEGVRQDFAQAAHWWRKAADQGFDGAQFNLGSLYYNGEGVPQDFAQAEHWWRKAADQGHVMAQRTIWAFCTSLAKV